MVGQQLVRFLPVHIQIVPFDQRLILRAVIALNFTQRDDARQLDQAVAVDIAAVNIVIAQRLDAGIRLFASGQIFKDAIIVGIDIRDDMLLVQLAGNKDRRNVLRDISRDDPLDRGDIGAGGNLALLEELTILPRIELHNLLLHIAVTADDKNVLHPAAVQVDRDELAVDRVHQLGQRAVTQRVDVQQLQNLPADLTAKDNLIARPIVKGDIKHMVKGAAGAFDLRNKGEALALLVKDIHRQRQIARRLEVDDCLVLAVAVQISQLHGLLVLASRRRAVARTGGHGGLDGALQIIILLWLLRNGIKSLRRFQEAPAEQTHHCQQADTYHNTFHGCASFHILILYHNL